MMVYKCDRCGKYFDDSRHSEYSTRLHLSDEAIDEEECDLCDNCYDALVHWYASKSELRLVLFDTALMNELNDQMKAHGATEEEFRKVYDGETHIRRMIEKYMIGEDDVTKAKELRADGKSLDEIAGALGYKDGEFSFTTTPAVTEE